MSTIINELLDLARIEARQGQDFVMETVPLQDIVRLVADDSAHRQGVLGPSCLTARCRCM